MLPYNLGVIGNGKTAALITDKGNLVFCCLPHFSSFTVFATLLDEKEGGFFDIEVPDNVAVTQQYLDRTNILVTTFVHEDWEFEVIDFMPRYMDHKRQMSCPPDIVRYIRIVRGVPVCRIHYQPKLCYAKYKTVHRVEDHHLKSYNQKGPYESIYLYSDQSYDDILNKEWLSLTQNTYFLVSYNQKILSPTETTINLMYQKTKAYWLQWSNNTRQFSHYNNEVLRSALVLKLLTYEKTGAMVAAVTTSLPEVIGKERNWDYRFCWIRDASLAISTLVNLGHSHLAKRFLDFLIQVIPFKNDSIQIMYGLHGEKVLTEKELDHLAGYRASKPVRIGNSAYKQKQHDIYGILADLLYEMFTLFKDQLHDVDELWTIVRSLVRHVQTNWKHKDHSIWEFRNMKQHFVFSKVLCWVAIDRATRIADLLDKKHYVSEWSKLRLVIKQDILDHGWNAKVGAFTQYYGGTELDAANLLMLDYGFVSADDPKYVSTVNKTYKTLSKDGLMYRYKGVDDFGKPQTSFTICTFWMIDSLYRIGRQDEAREYFETMLTYTNHLGLMSEGLDFVTKGFRGNFPQAYSHLGLIRTAMTLAGDDVSKADGEAFSPLYRLAFV